MPSVMPSTLAILLLLACDLRQPAVAADTDAPATTTSPPGTDDGVTPGPSGGDDSGGATTSATSGASESSGGSSTATGACAGDPVELTPATFPVDVVLAVDASGSMNLEMEAIRDQFPPFFAELHALGTVRAALIAPYPDVDLAGVCIGPPMGQDGCPSDDDNPPLFVHHPEALTSFGTLAGIIEARPIWGANFRDAAPLHVLVASDDNPATSADEFSDQLGGAFTFHALFAPMDPFTGCLEGDACCNVSSEAGTVLETLAEDTDGVSYSICELDAAPFFDEVLERVEADAAPRCHYTLAPTPVDPDLLAVFDDGDALPRRDGPDACDDGGWYWADSDVVALCLVTCDTAAEVSAEIGCAG